VFDVACGYYKPQPIIPRGWVWLYYLDPGVCDWEAGGGMQASLCYASGP
jgi:ABC-type multidrug transport system permease subunit